MNPIVQDVARAAAAGPTSQYGPQLAMDMEAELHRGPDAAPDQYEPITISIAALIVSIASLAWTVYQDLRKPNQPEPAEQVVARTVRVRLDPPSGLPQQELARVIDVTVEEVLHRTS